MANITLLGNPLNNAIVLLQDFGFFQVILPMLLIFVVIYGILQKTQIFVVKKNDATSQGEARPINALIAFVSAFFVIASTDIVESINTLLPNASFLLIVALLGLMFMAFVGFEPADFFTKTSMWGKGAAILMFIIFLGMLDASFSWNIPIIHQLVEALVNTNGTSADGELISSLAVLALIIALPFLVLYYLLTGNKPKLPSSNKGN